MSGAPHAGLIYAVVDPHAITMHRASWRLPASSACPLCQSYYTQTDCELPMCRAAHLRKLDQTEMLGIRTAWFEEVGGPPIGNKCVCLFFLLGAVRRQCHRMYRASTCTASRASHLLGSDCWKACGCH